VGDYRGGDIHPLNNSLNDQAGTIPELRRERRVPTVRPDCWQSKRNLQSARLDTRLSHGFWAPSDGGLGPVFRTTPVTIPSGWSA
jgi:hypothetical protein